MRIDYFITRTNTRHIVDKPAAAAAAAAAAVRFKEHNSNLVFVVVVLMCIYHARACAGARVHSPPPPAALCGNQERSLTFAPLWRFTVLRLRLDLRLFQLMTVALRDAAGARVNLETSAV